jgi:hypothetical protein
MKEGPLSSPPAHAWRHTKRFFYNESAYFPAATPSSSSARIATGDIAIAAVDAATGPGSSNGGELISVISEVRKAGSTIGTGSGNTARDSARRVPA